MVNRLVAKTVRSTSTATVSAFGSEQQTLWGNFLTLNKSFHGSFICLLIFKVKKNSFNVKNYFPCELKMDFLFGRVCMEGKK